MERGENSFIGNSLINYVILAILRCLTYFLSRFQAAAKKAAAEKAAAEKAAAEKAAAEKAA